MYAPHSFLQSQCEYIIDSSSVVLLTNNFHSATAPHEKMVEKKTQYTKLARKQKESLKKKTHFIENNKKKTL